MEIDDKESFDANVKGFAVLCAITIGLAFGKLIGLWAGLSWWWVTIPLWFPYAVMGCVLAAFLVLCIVAVLAGGFFGALAGITLLMKKGKSDGE